MTVTEPSGVSNHYTTDTIAGQISVCQLSPGTYTVTEDSTAPLPPSVSTSAPSAFFLNGVSQLTNTLSVTFTWDPTQPSTMNVLFVNMLVVQPS
jgi:hypothetical protein